MSRILISGASGFIGKPLAFFLQSKGYQVVSLSRRRKDNTIFWDPGQKIASRKNFEGFEAVIHLAGEPLSFSRWGEKKKTKIYRSRVESTSFLVDLLAASPPKIFISSSAMGFYGDQGEQKVSEELPSGSGFLASVCRDWEQASQTLSQKGSRVVWARFGMVLASSGGILKKILPFYRLGLGVRLGTGQQWMSWIHLEDLIAAIVFILETESIQGGVNFASPHPVRQETFSKSLAKVLSRPHFLAVPEWVLKLGFGLMAQELLLSSIRADPAKLLAANFHFKYPKLRCALEKVR